jgi:hypothetical protein
MLQGFQELIAASWRHLATVVTGLLPNLLAALFTLAVAVLVGTVAGRLTSRLLQAAKVDRAASRLGALGLLSRLGIDSASSLAAKVVKWGVVAAAFFPALYTLDPVLATDLLGRSLAYVPRVVIAIAIVWVGFLLSRFLGRAVLIAAVNGEVAHARVLAGATRVGVMLVAVAVMFEQIGVGRATVVTAFAILFGGVTLAAALAVGLGSQDIVRRWWAGQDRQQDAARHVDRIQHW